MRKGSTRSIQIIDKHGEEKRKVDEHEESLDKKEKVSRPFGISLKGLLPSLGPRSPSPVNFFTTEQNPSLP